MWISSTEMKLDPPSRARHGIPFALYSNRDILYAVALDLTIFQIPSTIQHMPYPLFSN
jgi:hypothetical protein